MRVIARICGGLGNQLFMYAYARRVALAHHAELVLDTTSGFTRDPFRREYALQHFHVAGRPASEWESYSDRFGIPRRRTARLVNRLLPAANRWYVHQESQGYDALVLTRRLRRSVYLEGYWQQAEHAEAIAEVLRDDLRFKWQPNEALARLGSRLRNSASVCVHVRRFGAPASLRVSQPPHELPVSYYDRALAEFRRRFERTEFHVFTENPTCPLIAHLLRVGCRLSGAGGSSGSSIADFWLMSQCRHFIVANSTYSWWAAWLGGDSASLIVAPSRTCDILNIEFTTPKGWFPLATDPEGFPNEL